MNPRGVVFFLVFAVIAAGGLSLRAAQLGARPMHCDEANQAVRTGILLEKGVYQYDPHEHHGPTLYYCAIPVLWLGGAHTLGESTETIFRIVPLIFGSGMLLMIVFMRRELGMAATLWATLFTAISHGLVFYSRYYIQEPMLVFFGMAAILAGVRYLHRPGFFWAATFGVACGLMHATKETCILLFAAGSGALLLTCAMARFREGISLRDIFGRLRPAHVAVALGAAAAVSITLFSSFFTHARGPLDSILTYSTYIARADGTGSSGIHDKPWHYYLQILCYTYRSAGPRWSEGIIVALALFAVFTAFTKRAKHLHATAEQNVHFIRFLSIYAFLLLFLFSAIPYKTPWNLLVFLHTFAILAGVGAAALLRAGRWLPLKALIGALLLLGAGHLAHQTRMGITYYAADPRNPYVYAHTSTALMRLVRRVDEIAAIHPDGKRMQINIIRPDGDYWPLPWYLRRYERVGYWTQFPAQPDAPMIIAEPALQEQLAETLQSEYLVEYHALRPSVLLLTYIRQDLWDTFMAARSAATHSAPASP